MRTGLDHCNMDSNKRQKLLHSGMLFPECRAINAKEWQMLDNNTCDS
jgi:hypothetical protein